MNVLAKEKDAVEIIYNSRANDSSDNNSRNPVLYKISAENNLIP
jgi:hypothetical protein